MLLFDFLELSERNSDIVATCHADRIAALIILLTSNWHPVNTSCVSIIFKSCDFVLVLMRSYKSCAVIAVLLMQNKTFMEFRISSNLRSPTGCFCTLFDSQRDPCFSDSAWAPGGGGSGFIVTPSFSADHSVAYVCIF